MLSQRQMIEYSNRAFDIHHTVSLMRHDERSPHCVWGAWEMNEGRLGDKILEAALSLAVFSGLVWYFVGG